MLSSYRVGSALLRLTGRGGKVGIRQLSTNGALRKIFDVKSEEDFKKSVLSASKPVIVDFHASWCGPCKVLGPLLKEVVQEFDEQVDLAQVDVDDLPELSIAHEVASIPAIHVFVAGARKDGFVGLQDKQYLMNFVKNLVSN